MHDITDYGRMMAISQIIFGQYHTYLGYSRWVRSEKQVFFSEKQLNDGNHGQGIKSAKIGTDRYLFG